MKKILLVFVCSLFAFETVLAQEKNAVGLRLGDGVEFLYNAIFRLGFFAIHVGDSSF